MNKSLSYTALSLLLAATVCGGTACRSQSSLHKPVRVQVAPKMSAAKPKHVAAAPRAGSAAHVPFEQGVYLYNQAYDKDLNGPAGSGTGNWDKYRAWLGTQNVSAEADPGWGPGDWYDCAQHVNWNLPWAKQQQRVSGSLPDVVLGIGQMPADPNGGDSWNQKLAWEDATWKAEAANDPALMAYFANYAKEVDDLGFKSVIIRMGYEFDGGWNPFGNLNVMSNMPGNYIKSWQNIVTAMRKADTKHVIRGFFWNPTDGNVQINQFDYYPGDDYTDFIGFDEYDFGYNGVYKGGPVQPTQAQQDAAWKTMELPRINRFADLARTHNKRVILGEWGLWQKGDSGHPSGGDNPSYIQHMYDWMSDPNNHVYMEVYFETPSDGDSSLSGIFHPTTFPKSAALYRELFGTPPPPSVPTAPTGLATAGGYKSASLTWNLSGGYPAATYSIYRGTSAGSAVPIASGLSETTFTDSGLKNGVTYYYAVKAANKVGKSSLSAKASVKPDIPANYVQDSGFESGDFSSWQVTDSSTAGASYTEKQHAHAGDWVYTNWANSPYQVTSFQKMAVANGPHTVSAWVKSSGGQSLCRMEINPSGPKPVFVPITAAGDWTQISAVVTVSDGTLQVGFQSKAAAGQWVNIDDVVVK